MSADIEKLIGRLEAAHGPDRELDIAIHYDAIGTIPTNNARLTPEMRRSHKETFAPHYTASIDAALPGECIGCVARHIPRQGEPTVWVAVHEPPRPGALSICGRGRTEPIARRIAALKVLSATNTGK